MADIQEGMRVTIRDRASTADDREKGMFFDHYRGLTGEVQRRYDDGRLAVVVDLDSLTNEVRQRHLEIQEQMKSKWLDGLSEEARGRLTERELDFRLRYTILVREQDIEGAGAEPGRQAASRQARARQAEDSARLLTDDDLNAAETAYLEQRKRLAHGDQ